VAIAFDGQSGLEATLELVPDLVISDIVMPGISGLDMCRAIRNDVRTSHIPIILLTAKTSEYSIRAGLESGASLYLVKPFDHEVLKKYVSNSLLLSTQTKRYFESYWGTQSRTDSSMNLPKGISSEKEDQFIRDVESLITANYSDDSFNVEKMAIALHISLSQLRRKIVALGGDSAGAMLKNYRLSRAKEMLIEMPEATISEVAFACGFSDPNYFSSAFGKDTGMTPRQFRAGKSDKTDS
jgi:YesN/AraC family two-component response regulator